MFVNQQIQADFLDQNLLKQLGDSWWIGLQRIRNQRDQTLNLLSVTANVWSSAGSNVAGPLTLAVQADDTQPELQKAGYLLQTGSGKALTSADTYRVVYSLVNQTGEVGTIQQTFVVRGNPF